MKYIIVLNSYRLPVNLRVLFLLFYNIFGKFVHK
nr:MAG TPA: hypothetical protein [Caudoviricetes sp.]